MTLHLSLSALNNSVRNALIMTIFNLKHYRSKTVSSQLKLKKAANTDDKRSVRIVPFKTPLVLPILKAHHKLPT